MLPGSWDLLPQAAPRFGIRFLGVQGSGFRVQGSGLRAQVSGFRVQGAVIRVWVEMHTGGARCMCPLGHLERRNLIRR